MNIYGLKKQAKECTRVIKNFKEKRRFDQADKSKAKLRRIRELIKEKRNETNKDNIGKR